MWQGYKEADFNAKTIDWLNDLTPEEVSNLYEEGITLKDENGFGKLDIYAPIQYINPGVHYIRWIGLMEILHTQSFKDLMTWPGFVVAYALSEEDEFLQNEEDPDRYTSRRIKPQKSKIGRDEFGNKVISITGNPGRKRVVRNMILRSCWRMWFGRPYFDLIPQDKLLGYKAANKSLMSDNGIYFMELYSDPFSASLAENRAKQAAFNQYIGIEKVYEQCLAESGFRF